MHRMAMALSSVFALVIGSTTGAAPPVLDGAEVVSVVERAKRRLIDARRPDGTWVDPTWNHEPAAKIAGHTALCTYALLQAGESPNSAVIRQAADALANTELYGTYNVALRCMVFANLVHWDPTGAYRKVLARDTEFLIRTNLNNGQWTYVAPTLPANLRRTSGASGDNSNSQLAMLALREAYYAGAEIPRAFWLKLEKYWVGAQQADGGWHYGANRGRSYGSMTAAGLATAFILMDVLHSNRCCSEATYRPTERGLDWLSRHFRPDRNPGHGAHWLYYLYGVERVGETSGRRYFGQHDWFAEGAAALLAHSKEGDWPGETQFAGPAFGLLFLARGVAPILFNKLEYGPGWNGNPRDVANVTRFLSKFKFDRPTNWQIISLDATADEWHDSPVLFVSMSDELKLDDPQLDKMRNYIEHGGTVWFDIPCKAKSGAVASVRRLSERLLPDRTFRPLDADHELFRLHFKIERRMRVFGVSNGYREQILLTDAELSCAWQRNETARRRDAFDLAGNVFLYASDKEFHDKLRNRTTLPRSTSKPETTITVAHLRHEGNWNPCPAALADLSAVLTARARVGLAVRSGVALDDAELSQARVAFLVGNGAFEVSASARANLARFLDGGGLLVVSPTIGDETFLRESSQIVEQIAGTAPTDVDAEDPLITGEFRDRFGFDTSKVAFTRALRFRRGAEASSGVQGIRAHGRWSVVIVPYDVVHGLTLQTPYNSLGYAGDDAARIAANIFLSALDGATSSGASESSGR